MKSIIRSILFIFVSSAVFAQSDYYWYKGEKVPLERNPEKKFVLLSENTTGQEALQQSFHTHGLRVDRFSKSQVQSSLRPFKGLSKAEKSWAVITKNGGIDGNLSEMQYSGKRSIIYEAPFYLTASGKEAGLSHLFYVKLKAAADVVVLEEFAKKYRVEILGNNRFMPLWYTLTCTDRSEGNALEMANAFYETSLFSAAEPDLMVDDSPNCVNDAFFGNQWGLDNAGQNGGTNGTDIRACEAWQATTGDPDIVVAVLDHGIELNHPDMPNMFPLSFDTETGTLPSMVRGRHGTACAGIIGAAQDNNLGVTGVAPNCQLMSISNSLVGNPNSRQTRADGLNWAWQNGADIISNSWHSGVQYQIIDDAIHNALTEGRDGLGCVVVFATGNNDGTVSYPANSNPDILAVGALSPCGERKNPGSCDGEGWWGSNFGTQLDIMAPGVLVSTTDRQGAQGYNNGDYTQTFNGTSAACPHVAGVAALILSVHPCLTQQQVADIIESTAQKVGGYAYQNESGRDNGTWHHEMGYGLIDAVAAVEAAADTLFLQNETVTTTLTHTAPFLIRTGNHVTPTIPQGDYVVAPGADVTCTAGNSIQLLPGFHAKNGAHFWAQIAPCDPGSSNVRLAQGGTSIQGETSAVKNAVLGSEDQLINEAFGIYPNPFTHTTTFMYTVTTDNAPVTLDIYNIYGQKAAVLLQHQKHAKGTHKAVWDGSGLSAGIYIYQLRIGDQIKSGKIILKR